MEINTRIDESDIASIKDSQPATFTVDAFPGRTFFRHRQAGQVVIIGAVVARKLFVDEDPVGRVVPFLKVARAIATA